MKTIYEGSTPTFLYSVPDLALKLGVTYQAVHQRIRQRRLPAPTYADGKRKFYTEPEVAQIIANEQKRTGQTVA